jgi:hypothetical protein
MYLVVLPFFVFVYIAIVAAEELYLSNHFGPAYAEYCRRVPRFLPRTRGLLTTIRGMDFDWKRLVRKEYGTIYSSISAVLLLVFWEHVHEQGFEASKDLLRVLAFVWIPVTLLYLVARVLKKRGTLGTG